MYKIVAAIGGWGQYLAVLICYYLVIKQLRHGTGDNNGSQILGTVMRKALIRLHPSDKQ